MDDAKEIVIINATKDIIVEMIRQNHFTYNEISDEMLPKVRNAYKDVYRSIAESVKANWFFKISNGDLDAVKLHWVNFNHLTIRKQNAFETRANKHNIAFCTLFLQYSFSETRILNNLAR